jgi:hypothetical protein
MRKLSAVAILLLAAIGLSLNVKAQSGTAYQIQTSGVSPIDYGSYWNIFADDMYAVLGDGDPYYISVNEHVMGDDTFGLAGTTHNIQFWNLRTGVKIDEPITGSIADNESHPVCNAVTRVGPKILFTTLDGTFSGQFNGTIHLPIYAQESCKRFYVVTYDQEGSTVTLQ